jgi:hypothetical protein
MVDERGRDKNQICKWWKKGKNEIWNNYQFILPARASHFRSVSKTISIPKDLGCRCNKRTCRSRCDIPDVSRQFRRKIIGCTGLLIGCHSILWPSVSWLRATFHVLWQHLHAPYPSWAHELVDLNLAAAREVLGVVYELLVNPVNFHVDDPSHLISDRNDWLQEGLP